MDAILQELQRLNKKGTTMWWWIIATAKPESTKVQIQAKRKQWIAQGKDAVLQERCRSAQRFSVVGSSPKQVFWLIDTDDPAAVDLITEHFGEFWNLETLPVVPQPINELLRH